MKSQSQSEQPARGFGLLAVRANVKADKYRMKGYLSGLIVCKINRQCIGMRGRPIPIPPPSQVRV